MKNNPNTRMLSWQHDLATGRPPRPVRRGVDIGHLEWLVCFTSFTMLLLVSSWAAMQGGAQIVVLLFMAPWGLILLRQPYYAFLSIIRNWFLLVLPLLALVSFMWSDVPATSLRSSLQFIVTILIGIWAASCIKPRIAISALMSALGLMIVLSVLLEPNSNQGIFGSKNYFALCISLLMLTAVTVTLDRSQSRFFRFMGLLAVGLSPPVLVLAQSVGALVNTVATLAMFVMLRAAIRLRPELRFFGLTIIFLFGIFVLLLGSLYLNFSDVLNHLGKDTSLTGRTLLWEHALASIWEHPVAGLGYQAFWQVGNWSAEQLWLYSHVPIKNGYHFHNMYLQVAVDLGLIGLLFFIAIFVVLMARMVAALSGPPPKAEHMFAMIIFVFFLLRSPIEVDLFFPFTIPSILICMMWIYLPPIRFRRRDINPFFGKIIHTAGGNIGVSVKQNIY